MYAFLHSKMLLIKLRCETEIEEVANNLLPEDKKKLLKAIQDYDNDNKDKIENILNRV